MIDYILANGRAVSRAIVSILSILALLIIKASAQSGTGLTGQYYDTSNFTSLMTTRTDAGVNFNWGTTIPSGTTITNADSFSVIWTGQIEPEFTENYTFFVTADDSATLWINDQIICHRSYFQTGNTPIIGQIRLQAGKRVNLRLEYIERTSTASVRLEWQSSSRARELVPAVRLYPARIAKAGGSLLKEHWGSITGSLISSLTTHSNYPNRPGGREFVTSFECLARDWADNYGTRVTGFIVPPVSGSYTFALSGDDTAELWLSTDATTANGSLIASVASASAFRQWDFSPATQQSAPRTLVQGQRYYVELLHKEGTGTDHWSVGWKKPGESAFSVIPGSALVQAGLTRTQPAQAAVFDTIARDHPRLYATGESFSRLRGLWQSSTPSTAKTWATTIIAQADAIIPTNSVTYPMNVDSARVVMNNMYKLGLAWQLTGDSKYPERAWIELNAVGAFADWFPNSREFLVTSECTHGFAIAYDWMYAYWTQPRRDTIRTALVNKGLNAGLSAYKNNFWALRSNSSSANWAIVCNSGLVSGALAVGTESETLCEDILTRAMNSLRGNFRRFTTDQGAIHEGFTYLEYAQRYAVRGLAGMEWVLGSDFGLSSTQAMSETASVPIYFGGPSGVTFCASDDAESALRRGWLWPWSARRYNQPFHNSWNNTNNNPIALDALWQVDGGLTPASAGASPDMACKGEANAGFQPQEYFSLRSSWSDPRSTFVAAKAGEILTSHGHYDVGTFCLDALGKHWFSDLGKELYSTPAAREDLYRYRAEGHNTLVISPGTGAGNVKPSFSPLITYQGKTSAAGAYGIHDLTASHSGMSRVWRGIRMIGQRDEVLIQDEMVSATAKTAWWFAHFPSKLTTATLNVDGTSVTLAQGTERLWCKIVSGGGIFQIMDAAPLPSSPNPGVQTVNSNHKKLAINLSNVTNTTLAVWFVPLASGENPPTSLPTITPLNTWTIDNSNFPPIANGSSVTSVNNQSVDVDLSTLADDDNTPASALIFALSNVQGGAASLLPDGRTARFTPTPGGIGAARFDFTATDSGGLTSSAATVTVGGSPIIYTWSALTSGNWSAGTNWVSNTPATSYRGADVRFLTGQALADGTTVTASNDLPGTTQMNSLSFNGSLAAAGSVTVNLSGNPLQLGANGPTLPTMSLSGPTSGLTYNVNPNIELAATTTLNGANSGRVNFNGILSGVGGFTRSGSSGSIYFANNNTYQGPTVISSGGLFVGLSGSTSTSGSLGTGDVSTSGSITFQRANTYNVANKISGVGGIIQFGTGALTLNPQNTYSGSTQIYAGVLVASSLNSINGGEPPFESSSLGAPTTVGTGTIGLASGATATLRYIGEGETTDRVVNLRSSASGTIEQAGTGLLKFTSNFTATGASTKTLSLTGSTAGTGELAGAVVDNSPTNKTNLAKSGSGTWMLSGTNSYTGTTAVSNGTLVVNGSIASPSLLTISAGARLSGSGTIASPVTVTGTLAPGDSFGTLGISGAISFGSASRLIWESGANNTSVIDQLNATAISLTSGARIDVALNNPGSNVNFLHSFWRNARSFPVIVGISMSGTFSLGTISTDVGGRPAATYGSFSLQHTGTGVNLLWTPLPGLPGIDDPTLTLIHPAGDVVSLVNSALKLRVAATSTSGAGTSIAWSEVSGPGTATFAAPATSDTFASFSAAGTYVLRCTVSNPVGVVTKDFTVHVATPTVLTLREGVDDYSHQSTFIRGDGNTWNSGARDQFIVGRGSSFFRGLLSFDIPALSLGSTVENVTLDLWVSELGTGTTALGTLELRQLLTTFLEGTGDGSTAADGTGTGADWNTRTGDSTDPWSTPGGASGVDFASALLASGNGFIPTSTAVGTKVTLANATATLKDAVASAAGGTTPLGFYFTAGATTGANVFGRFASNDHATLAWRPLLTIQTSNHPVPDIDPGSAPAAAAGVSVGLGGNTSNSLSAGWSIVNGPGQVWFGNTASVTSTVKFSAPGSYVLRLAATNANGEAARDLSVTVTGAAMTAIEIWRQNHFGNHANTGIGADSADANNDGETNLLEFATEQNPYASTLVQTTLLKTAIALEFSYTRSRAAFNSGYGFDVQFSDTLNPPWTSVGPGIMIADGPLQSVTATIPLGNPSRFARLRVNTP